MISVRALGPQPLAKDFREHEMDKVRLIRLKNLMVAGNFFANLVGVQVVSLITLRSIAPPPEELVILADSVDIVFLPVVFVSVFLFTLVYERPVRQFLNALYGDAGAVTEHLRTQARRRLLNEPFVLIAVDFAVWATAAVVYPLVFSIAHDGELSLHRIVFRTMMVCMITLIVAFFLLEHILQKKMVPHFFPEGGLSRVAETLRIRIRTRVGALFVASNIIPCLAFVFIVRETYTSPLEPSRLLELLRNSILTNSLIFIFTGIFLAGLVVFNLTKPLEEIISVLKSIRNGRLDSRVRVISNDEIGYAGDAINDMAEGLREREKLRQSLELAREVQLNLLPGSPPQLEGLDIAGRSLYCDRTGGDYFDFFERDGREGGRLAVVVGDVAGHGISSALLMATARAFVRIRSSLPGSIARVVTDVNAQLSRDVGDSGRFMTLFFLGIDPEKGKVTWVRAGHDPAILYDPVADSFDELKGKGLPLGVDETWEYEEAEMSGLTGGQVVVLATDGVWEARGPDGKMFGKEPLFEIVRKYRDRGAEEILDEIAAALKEFKGGLELEDDITLVVVVLGR